MQRIGHHRGLTSLFGVCKTGLVSHIEYDRNIQTLIYKSEFSNWKHDLETYDGITTRPLLYHLKEVAQRKRFVKANGSMKGATTGNFNFSIKQPYGVN